MVTWKAALLPCVWTLALAGCQYYDVLVDSAGQEPDARIDEHPGDGDPGRPHADYPYVEPILPDGDPGVHNPSDCNPSAPPPGDEDTCCLDIYGMHAFASGCGEVPYVNQVHINQDVCFVFFWIGNFTCTGTIHNFDYLELTCSGINDPCYGTIDPLKPFAVICSKTCKFVIGPL